MEILHKLFSTYFPESGYSLNFNFCENVYYVEINFYSNYETVKISRNLNYIINTLCMENDVTILSLSINNTSPAECKLSLRLEKKDEENE